MRRQAVAEVRIKNFKAIRDSGPIKLSPLTVFIGNNGAGKSSLVEALETLRLIALEGLDHAMSRWHGIEHVRNKAGASSFMFSEKGERRNKRLLSLRVRGTAGKDAYNAFTEFGSLGDDDRLVFFDESVRLGGSSKITREQGGLTLPFADPDRVYQLQDHESLLGRVPGFTEIVTGWQFLALSPDQMGEPQTAPRTDANVTLHRGGNNVASVLRQIRELDRETFDGLVQTLQYVLPYAKDLQSTQSREVERQDFLQLIEGSFDIPGWMLSTGTLRIVAMLAALRHPSPPSLLVIEEIENGLDPRTLNLVLDEIRQVIEEGRTQVILTTHSPYLLDLLPLDFIVTVERKDGQPEFKRPYDDPALEKWRGEFTGGELYRMGKLTGTNR